MKKTTSIHTDDKNEELPLSFGQFIEDDKQLYKTIQNSGKKIGGPYSTKDRFERRQEVYRLHFDHGISATKIAELMRINRHTISADIQYWYTKFAKEWNKKDVNASIMKQIHRLEIQRTRLREDLEDLENIEQKLAVERLLLEIENRISHIMVTSVQKTDQLMQNSLRMLNEWTKKNNTEHRFIDRWSLLRIPVKKYEKILAILNDS